jgi:hypothetical protein
MIHTAQTHTEADMPESGTYLAGSESTDRMYLIELKDDGSATCDCPAWRFTPGPRKDAVCKHIRKLRGELVAR